jgi:outer membrane protein assembly factor BamB
LTDSEAAREFAGISSKPEPEAALAFARRHPLSSFYEPALLLAADRLLEGGRFWEGAQILHTAARHRSGMKGEEAWMRRLTFARRRIASPASSPPFEVKTLEVKTRIALPDTGVVRIRGKILSPTPLPTVFPCGARTAVALPRGIAFLDKKDGTVEKWAPTGAWPEPERAGISGLPFLGRRGREVVTGRPSEYPVASEGDLFLTLDGVKVLPEEVESRSRGRSPRIAAWTLDAKGGKPRLLWRESAAVILGKGHSEETFFHTPPVVQGGRAWFGMAVRGHSPRILLACIDARSGGLLWNRLLCGLPRISRRFRVSPMQVFPPRGEILLHEGRIYVQTNAGLFAVLDARTGDPLWGVSYKRRDWGRFVNLWRIIMGGEVPGGVPIWQHLGPPLPVGDRLVFAPWDSPLVLSVDRNGGEAQVVWNAAELHGKKSLTAILGVRENLLILGLDDRLVALDAARSWARRWYLLSAELTGKEGYRGVPTGPAVFSGSTAVFPTTKGIYLLDAGTGTLKPGRESRFLFGWSRVGTVRLHLVRGELVAASGKRLWIFKGG